MTEAIDPLTPPDCALQDFKFMPLDVQRLRDSDLASDQTPEENWAAVLLWAASWHQIPAASVPNSDQWLAKQAGYVARGRIDKRWEEIRAGAMRGFVLCSDGRFYHPVVAEKAREAWLSKLKQRFDTEKSRIKQHNARHGTEVPYPEWNQWLASGCITGQPLSVAGDTEVTSPKRSRKTPPKRQGKGQRQGHGQGNIKSPSDSGAATPPRSKRCPEDFQVSAELVQWAGANAPNVDWRDETAAMRDWEFKESRSDWDAVWRTWMRRAQKAHDEGRSTVAARRSPLPTAREQRMQEALGPMANLATHSVPGNFIETEVRDVTLAIDS